MPGGASQDLLQGFTWLDAIWALIIAALLLRGFLRGFLQELLELAGLALAIYAGLRTYEPGAEWLMQHVPGLPEQAARAGAFGVTAAAVVALVSVFTGMVAHLTRLSPLSWVDSLAGAAFGGIKGLAVVALLVVLLSGIPDAALRSLVSDSRISREIRLAVPLVWEGLRRALSGRLPPLPVLEEWSHGSRPGPLAPRTPPLPARDDALI